MKKTLTTTVAAAVIAIAAASTPAKAQVEAWVIPAIIAAGIGGVTVGAVATQANARPGNIYVQPRAEAVCHIVRERTAAGYRRVEVCD
jgi:predicted anti-sigma-YlaC factor YlaD